MWASHLAPGQLDFVVVVAAAVIVVVDLTQARVIREKGLSLEEMPPLSWPIGKSAGHFIGYLLPWEDPDHCGCTTLRRCFSVV